MTIDMLTIEARKKLLIIPYPTILLKVSLPKNICYIICHKGNKNY